MRLHPKLLQAGSLARYDRPGDVFTAELGDVVLILLQPSGETRTRTKAGGKSGAAFGIRVPKLKDLMPAEAVRKLRPDQVGDGRVFGKGVGCHLICPAFGSLFFNIIGCRCDEFLAVQ